MKLTVWDYVHAAFNARPAGMFVPPNWIGLGIFGFLGVLNPGFWIIGAGCELAYLGWLGTHPRFQKLVSGGRLLDERRQWQKKLYELIRQLPPGDQQRYRALEARCQGILEQQSHGATLSPGLDEQGEGLGRLVWIYLRLLLTRESIRKIIHEPSNSPEQAAQLKERIQALQEQLQQTSVSEDLRKSLTAQIEILQQRQEKKREAVEKLAFLDAELTRIQEQVELLREQSVLSTDPEVVSQRIDQITTTLGGTNQWIRDQQKIYGAMEDLLSDPPPLVVQSSKESQ
jgi:DNA repair exonuclease SbcCD ATPase subunit